MSELSDKLKKGERDAKNFGSVLGGAFKGAAKDMAGFALSASKSLASLALGNIGIAAQAKRVLEFRDSLVALKVAAGLGEGEMAGLKTQIHGVATASNQMQEDVTASLNAFVEKTGDIVTARKNLELYGKVATATGTAMEDVARIGVELSDKMKIKDQGASFAILSSMAKAGAIELKDLATKGPRLLAAAASAGAKDELGLRKTSALAQVYAKGFGGTGTGASVTTAVENTFASIAKKQGKIEGMGIKVKGQDQFDVLKNIIKKTGGDEAALRGIFTQQAMRGVLAMVREYDKKSGKFGKFDELSAIRPDAGMLDKDFKERRATGLAELQATQIRINIASEKNLGDGFDMLAHKSGVLAGVFESITARPWAAAGGVAAALVAKNVISGLLANKFGGGKGGGLIGGALGVQKVYVVNMGGGGMPGAPGMPSVPGGPSILAAVAPAMAITGALVYPLMRLADSQANKTTELIDKFNGANPVSDDAVRYFGSSYSRANKATFRKGEPLIAAPGADFGNADDMKQQWESEASGPTVQMLLQELVTLNRNAGLNVTITDAQVSVEGHGSRSPKAMKRRGFQSGEAP